MLSRVALVAPEGTERTELVRYLEGAGFEVLVAVAPPRRAASATSLVWLTAQDADPAIVASALESWLNAAARRAVVVAWRPATLAAVVDAHGDRLMVLPAPVFGWQLVDALRGGRMLAT